MRLPLFPLQLPRLRLGPQVQDPGTANTRAYQQVLPTRLEKDALQRRVWERCLLETRSVHCTQSSPGRRRETELTNDL